MLLCKAHFAYLFFLKIFSPSYSSQENKDHRSSHQASHTALGFAGLCDFQVSNTLALATLVWAHFSRDDRRKHAQLENNVQILTLFHYSVTLSKPLCLPGFQFSVKQTCWADKYTEEPDRDDANEQNRPGLIQKSVVGMMENLRRHAQFKGGNHNLFATQKIQVLSCQLFWFLIRSGGKLGFCGNFLFLNLIIIQTQKVFLDCKHTCPSQSGSVGQRFATSRLDILQDGGPSPAPCAATALACDTVGFPGFHGRHTWSLQGWKPQSPSLSCCQVNQNFLSSRKKKMCFERLENK